MNIISDNQVRPQGAECRAALFAILVLTLKCDPSWAYAGFGQAPPRATSAGISFSA